MNGRRLWCVVVSCFVVCACLGASAQSVNFAPPSYTSMCTSWTGSAWNCYAGPALQGDLNGDGKLDLLIKSGPQLAILFGIGDGTFQQPVTININYSGQPDSSYQGSLEIGDFNRDGKLDLLTLAPNAASGYTVGVLFGNGDGTFQLPLNTFVTLNAAPSSLTVGDFNHDRKLDVAIPDGPEVKVFLGNGDGTFQTSPRTSSFGAVPAQFATADFNLDGNLDLIAGLYVALGNGNGTFQTPTRITNSDVVGADSGGSLNKSIVGDFDGDAKPDVVVWRYDGPEANQGDVTILFGNGDGTFRPLSPQLGMPIWLYGPILGGGDFNLNGKFEALGTYARYPHGFSAGAVSAGGTLSLLSSFYFPDDVPQEFVVGDFNGDNSPDVGISFVNENVGPTSTRLKRGILMFLNMRGTHVDITVSDSVPVSGQPLTFTATVTGSVNKDVTPAGIVAFTDRNRIIGAAQLSYGEATLTLQNLGLGMHNVTAYYLGDTNFNPNWSPTARTHVRNKAKK